ncbi:MAG TPA: hypothetical protein VEG25_09355 [Burkholderiales bacterium]|nr:hypothetical protein [Burkholderiales bacterium]
MKKFFIYLQTLLCGVLLSLFALDAHAVISIGNLTVESFRNEALKAKIDFQADANEVVTPQCLSLGTPDTEAENKLPYLTDANISLETRNGKSVISITTSQAVTENAFNLLVKIQCPDQLQIARDFTVQLGTRTGNVLTVPVPTEAASPEATPVTGMQPKGGGVYWSMRPGDTLAGIAQKIYPKELFHPKELIYQQKMVWAIVQYNPQVFPSGKPDEPPTGTVIIIPDLRDVPAVKVPGEPGTAKSRRSSGKSKSTEAKSATAGEAAPQQ